MNVPDYILKAARLLQEKGYSAYAVGGCVRDSLMDKNPHDWDMTTNASPDEMKQVFCRYRIIETGIKHGTVTVLFDRQPVEITVYRIEGEYSDNRHPDCVRFTDKLTNDLSRRDFTINAMAYNPLKDETVDLFGGREDLKNRLIRCVGSPDKRFNEDALRILRALRFSSVLDFEIEGETAESIRKNRFLLNNLSAERIYSELKKLIMGKNVYNVLMSFPDVFAVILPEIKREIGYNQKNPHHIYSLWEHTAKAVASAPADLNVRLCMLLHDCGKPYCRTFDEKGIAHYYGHYNISADMAQAAFLRLKSDKKTANEVVMLIKNHDTPIPVSEKIVKRRLRQYGSEAFFKLVEVHRADNLAQHPDYIKERLEELEQIKLIAFEIINSEQCFSLGSLAVKGNDVAALGYTGKEIGQALERLLTAVTDGKIPNEKNALLEYIKR